MNEIPRSAEVVRKTVRDLCAKSNSPEEFEAKLDEELGYPCGGAICWSYPTDNAGIEARDIVSALGGLVSASGAMVMIMLHHHTGTISL